MYLKVNSETYRKFEIEIANAASSLGGLAEELGDAATETQRLIRKLISNNVDGNVIRCADVDSLVSLLKNFGKHELAGTIESLQKRIQGQIEILITNVELFGLLANAKDSDGVSLAVETIVNHPLVSGITVARALNKLAALNALPRETVIKLFSILPSVAAEMNAQDVANSLNALPKLGIRQCPPELLARLKIIAAEMNAQEVANSLNALPKLGIRQCPPDELLAQLRIVAAEMNPRDVANTLNALPKLGIRQCPPELLARLKIIAPEMNAQDVANSLNALPKLGIRQCPPELLARLKIIAAEMNAQEVANSLNALPKLGIRQCPPELFVKLCNKNILKEIEQNDVYRKQMLEDLMSFSNIISLCEDVIERERDTYVLEFVSRIRGNAQGNAYSDIEQEPPQVLEQPAQAAAPATQIGASIKRRLTPSEQTSLQGHPVLQVVEAMLRNAEKFNAGNLRRALEKAKCKVPSSLPALITIIKVALDKGIPLHECPDIYNFLRNQELIE